MPQLDKFSFFVQIIWLFIFFFFSYILLRYEILPSILYILRLRQKSLENLYNNINNIIVEKFVFDKFLNKFLSKQRFLNINNFYLEFNSKFDKYLNKVFFKKYEG